jgi:hypothetical protein
MSDKRAVAPSDKVPSCSHDASPSARAARRFFAPSATCFMVRLAYRGSTLADLCRPLCTYLGVGQIGVGRLGEPSVPE